MPVNSWVASGNSRTHAALVQCKRLLPSCVQEAQRRHTGHNAASEYGLYPGILRASQCKALALLVPAAKQQVLAQAGKLPSQPPSQSGQGAHGAEAGAFGLEQMDQCAPLLSS